MRVEWKEDCAPRDADGCIADGHPGAIFVDFAGEVIGTTRSLFGTVYLTVMLDDGTVRDVEATRVRKALEDGDGK